MPSLLSLPYLGYLRRDDPTYLRTRALVLSERNPWCAAEPPLLPCQMRGPPVS